MSLGEEVSQIDSQGHVFEFPPHPLPLGVWMMFFFRARPCPCFRRYSSLLGYQSLSIYTGSAPTSPSWWGTSPFYSSDYFYMHSLLVKSILGKGPLSKKSWEKWRIWRILIELTRRECRVFYACLMKLHGRFTAQRMIGSLSMNNDSECNVQLTVLYYVVCVKSQHWYDL